MIEVWRTLACRLSYRANVSGFYCSLCLLQVHVACSFQNHFGIIINWQRKAMIDYYTVVGKKKIKEWERICLFSCHFHESRCCTEPRDSFLLLYLVLAATCAILSSLCSHLHKYMRMRYRNTFAYAWDTICIRVDFWFSTLPSGLLHYLQSRVVLMESTLYMSRTLSAIKSDYIIKIAICGGNFYQLLQRYCWLYTIQFVFRF